MAGHRLAPSIVLPRELAVITPAPADSAELFRRLRATDHRISQIVFGSPAMYRMLAQLHSPFAVLDLPMVMETGQAITCLRRLHRFSPIVLLAEDRIDAAACLDAHAHDVLRRRAHPDELLARLAAHWRRHRTAGRIRQPLQVHDPDSGARVDLHLPARVPGREGLLLTALLRRDGIASRSELRACLGAGGAPVSDRALTQMVYRLNIRLQPYGLRVRNSWAVGYQLTTSRGSAAASPGGNRPAPSAVPAASYAAGHDH